MPSVLIITNDHDEHADAVIEELTKRDVPVFRFHPEEFPGAYSVSIGIRDGRMEGEIRTAEQAVAFTDICAAWYRRARNLFEGRRLSLTCEKLDNYVRAQSMATVLALCEALETLWVGHPHRLRRAEIKALQLAKASQAGLTTPHTLISNDPTEVRRFVDALGERECALKPLIALGVSDADGYRLPLTTTLPPGHSLDSVALAATIFQPYVEKAFELRCVVMGERIFCAKMDSQATEQTRRDWRAGAPDHEIFVLPQEVEAAIHRLMGSFGLNFASLDMIVTPDGEFVFLELNPNGQWLWLELELGLPLVASMADLLTSNHPGPIRRAEAVQAGRREVAHAS
jgi:glutathione synthase/RimK-type ligase-like ATP-grasp enzyme